jgi:hypothetical protein
MELWVRCNIPTITVTASVTVIPEQAAEDASEGRSSIWMSSVE